MKVKYYTDDLPVEHPAKEFVMTMDPETVRGREMHEIDRETYYKQLGINLTFVK